MGLLDNLKTIWNNLLTLDDLTADPGRRKRLMETVTQREYYLGQHPAQLKVKGPYDDNVTLNFAGLIVNRGVAMLLGKGLEFDLPGDPEEIEQDDGSTLTVEPENQAYINAVWQVNKKDIFLQKMAQFGAMHGTCYIKIVPEYYEHPEMPQLLPRLVALDPLYMTIETDPEDQDVVLRYVNRFNIMRAGKEIARRETIQQLFQTVDESGQPTIESGRIAGFASQGWEVINEESDLGTGGRWRELSREVWDYDFPPVIHWQNMPLAGSVYGQPDISTDIQHLQDKTNYSLSNIFKIVRFHAHPKTWARGTQLGNKVQWGPDEIVTIQGQDAMIQNLEMQSDLASARALFGDIRQALFDVSRTVDLESMRDKIGSITNFGLRVLFYDSLAKLNSKQELWGEGLTELNHRLLELAGFTDSDGGSVVWPSPLPEDQVESTQAVSNDLANGLVSKQTAAMKRGYDWEKEQERLQEESEQDDSVGARLLRQFNTGF